MNNADGPSSQASLSEAKIKHAARRLFQAALESARDRGDQRVPSAMEGREEEWTTTAVTAHRQAVMRQSESSAPPRPSTGTSDPGQPGPVREAVLDAICVTAIPLFLLGGGIAVWVTLSTSDPNVLDVLRPIYWRTASFLITGLLTVTVLSVSVAALLAKIPWFANGTARHFLGVASGAVLFTVAMSLLVGHDFRNDRRAGALALNVSKDRLRDLAVVAMQIQRSTGRFPELNDRFGAVTIETSRVSVQEAVYEGRTTGLQGSIRLEVRPDTAQLWWLHDNLRTPLGTLVTGRVERVSGGAITLTEASGRQRTVAVASDASWIHPGDSLRLVLGTDQQPIKLHEVERVTHVLPD